MSKPLAIRRLDSRNHYLRAGLDEWRQLRDRLSPRGDVVSEAGRKRTLEVFGEPLSPQQVVERICRDVRENGLPAVLDYSRRIDKADLTADTLRVSAVELAEAHKAARPDFLGTIRRIRDNIRRFQTAILHHDVRVELSHGGYLAQRYTPLARVGICVPGGAAAYPSTVLMTAVPAQAAGVPELAVVAPPTKFGANNPDLLATCHELGIREVYRVGGAQAVAALAYGVDGLPRVDKIVGPGNLFVALAKRHVFGDVGIDSIAGPSEVVVIADETTRPDYTAADLLAQAEHAPGASILITWSEAILEATAAELAKQAAHLERGDLARESLEQFGALILVRDADEAAEIANLIAPEHLHIATDNPEPLLGRIRNAGAVFLGNHSPVALGDYVAGPSHVLPTGGTARFASGLTSNDFLRSGSVIHFTPEAMGAVADDIRQMAEVEGLTAHRDSVIRRVTRGDSMSSDAPEEAAAGTMAWWREILWREHLGSEDSFMWQVRCEARWDRATYDRLFAAMLACCKAHEGKDTIERWIADVFWFLSGWASLQAEKLWPDSRYHQNAGTNFDHLAWWLFQGLSRADDEFENLD